MKLETERLVIRDFAEEDWSRVHPYCSDEEVTRYTFWGPNSIEDTKRYIDHTLICLKQDPRMSYEMAVVVRETGEIIGNCCIHITDGSNAEVGYVLSRGHWGKGYATEVAQALIVFGFREKKMHRIYATCRPDNIGSYRVMEKAGMTREGLLREHIFAKGKWHNSYLYSILESEYL